MESNFESKEEISFEGINLDKDDLTTLDSILADKFLSIEEPLEFTNLVKDKTIVIKGKDYKEVSSYISEWMYKLKDANFPEVFEEKFQMINEGFPIKQFDLIKNTNEYVYV